MSEQIRKFVIRKTGMREFYGIKDHPENISERFLLDAVESIDITETHCIISQIPFRILIWNTKLMEGNYSERLPFSIDRAGVTVAHGELHVKEVFMVASTYLKIAEVVQSEYGSCTRFRQKLFFQLFPSDELTLFQKRVYGVLYALPRKVILISYSYGCYFNLFPMDFQGSNRNGLIFLGLRNSNITLPKMREYGRFLILETGDIDFKDIYNLGKFHSSEPPAMDQLPFSFYDSQLFTLPVPEFTKSYKEVEVLSIKDQGSHSLIIGKTRNELKQLGAQNMYHVHCFHYHKFYNHKYSDR